MPLCAVPTDFRGSVSEQPGAGVMRGDVNYEKLFFEIWVEVGLNNLFFSILMISLFSVFFVGFCVIEGVSAWVQMRHSRSRSDPKRQAILG